MPDSDEIGVLVDEFARMLDGHLPTGGNAADALDEPGKIWSAVVSGGWLELSEHSEPDEPAMHIRDVARFCLAWGRRLIPLPFSETVLIRRWAGSVPADAMLTVTIPTLGQPMTPRAGPGVARVASLPCDVAVLQTDRPETVDAYAPSLPVGMGGISTDLGPGPLAQLRALLAAEAVGAAEECLVRAVDYAQLRMAYGRPISAFQSLRHLLADMQINLDFAKSALFWALETTGDENRRAARMVAELCAKVGAGAFQVHGGIAYTWELGLHRYLRHIEAVRDLVSVGEASQPKTS